MNQHHLFTVLVWLALLSCTGASALNVKKAKPSDFMQAVDAILQLEVKNHVISKKGKQYSLRIFKAIESEKRLDTVHLQSLCLIYSTDAVTSETAGFLSVNGHEFNYTYLIGTLTFHQEHFYPERMIDSLLNFKCWCNLTPKEAVYQNVPISIGYAQKTASGLMVQADSCQVRFY